MPFFYVFCYHFYAQKAYMPFFDLFQQDAEPLKLGAGEILFRQGEAGSAMYVLLQGEAEILINDVSFEKCTSGSIVGEIAVIDGSLRSATVVTSTPCVFAVVDSRRFRFLVDETPGFAIAVMQVLAGRLKRCSARVLSQL
jgi:CRP-like cAMP-binding protein